MQALTNRYLGAAAFAAGWLATTPALATQAINAADDTHYSTKTPYRYIPTEFTPAPPGYRPTLVQFVGRHGSRHLSSAKYDKTLFELLSIAEERGQLTEAGRTLKQEIAQLIAVQEDVYGELSILGGEELHAIGERLAERFPEIFEKGRPIIAHATYKDRTPQSRDHFLSGLQSALGEATPPIDARQYAKGRDPYLRPYDLASRYRDYKSSGEWQAVIDAYLDQRSETDAFARDIIGQFIDDELFAELERGELALEDAKGRVALATPTDAANNLYQLYIISPNIEREGEFDFGRYFSEEQLAWYEDLDLMETFYAKGPSLTSSNLPREIAAPMVKELITSTDEALAQKSASGIFNFSHAELIMPLAAYLEIEGADESQDDPAQVSATWNGKAITAMAANIQWVLYQNDGGDDTLVKMLHNEREIAFPLPTEHYPYYDWESVKTYYADKVNQSGIALDNTLDDDIEALKNDF
ncbi:histidine-type phosphatase [Halomonas aquamarina]|uniref:Histidine-type phosphatase n=1 Tax=Vreelandella aquamarina TaxID=77097 RepID=A0ACC5VSW0_9GAMM|nr:histidine-type phosphatase [Halomonas aquamarina]MBZ5486814.1 histidine-type phosphatase [Halomonas aquamarina]